MSLTPYPDPTEARQQPVAWVTGASSGIGRAVALRLAGAGYRVAASARNQAALTDLAAEARRAGATILPVPLDVTDERATLDAVAVIEADLGPIALAVLCAGTHIAMTAASFGTATCRTLIEVNLMGTVHSLAGLIPRMTQRRAGRIAVVASVAGYCGLPSAAAYGATKAGLINMCEALRPDLATHGVVLQLVNPGFVATPLTAKNDFAMPMMISTDRAAEAIMRGLRSSRFEIAFPRRFALLMKLLRALPYPLFFAITRRMIRR